MGMLGRATMMAAALALGMTPATAAATPQDIASTHAYIQANYAFARATEAKAGVAQAEIEALDHKLAEQCPNIGVGAPQTEESQHLSDEVVVALWSISYGTDARPIRAFAAAVERLRWSNNKLAHIAQSYVKSLHELATLPMPDICGDVSAWKASGFKVIPATTAQLDRRAEEIEGKTIPTSLLAPYERPSDRATLAATLRLEAKLARTETEVGFNDWDVLLGTLGLNQ
jgi:hypothetical protein